MPGRSRPSAGTVVVVVGGAVVVVGAVAVVEVVDGGADSGGASAGAVAGTVATGASGARRPAAVAADRVQLRASLMAAQWSGVAWCQTQKEKPVTPRDCAAWMKRTRCSFGGGPGGPPSGPASYAWPTGMIGLPNATRS